MSNIPVRPHILWVGPKALVTGGLANFRNDTITNGTQTTAEPIATNIWP